MNYPWSLFTAVYPVWYGLLLIWGLHGTLQIPIPLQQTNLRPIFDLTRKNLLQRTTLRVLSQGEMSNSTLLSKKSLPKGEGGLAPEVDPYTWDRRPRPLGG